MRKYLIASHSTLAGGMLSAFELIAGKAENVYVLEAYCGINKSPEDDIREIVSSLNADDEMVVFTDLIGGSVTNQLVNIALRKNVYVISGMNLPLILEIILADADDDINEIIKQSILNARQQIVLVNNIIKPEND